MKPACPKTTGLRSGLCAAKRSRSDVSRSLGDTCPRKHLSLAGRLLRSKSESCAALRRTAWLWLSATPSPGRKTACTSPGRFIARAAVASRQRGIWPRLAFRAAQCTRIGEAESRRDSPIWAFFAGNPPRSLPSGHHAGIHRTPQPKVRQTGKTGRTPSAAETPQPRSARPSTTRAMHSGETKWVCTIPGISGLLVAPLEGG